MKPGRSDGRWPSNEETPPCDRAGFGRRLLTGQKREWHRLFKLMDILTKAPLGKAAASHFQAVVRPRLPGHPKQDQDGLQPSIELFRSQHFTFDFMPPVTGSRSKRWLQLSKHGRGDRRIAFV